MNRKQRRAAAKLEARPSPPQQDSAAAIVATGIAELLTTGQKLHEAGRLAVAEDCYRRILAAQPDHDEALHLSGVIAHQQGRHDAAIRAIGKAIQRNPQNPVYFCNLGSAFLGQGRLDEAVAACRQAISIKPDFVEAHSNLGIALQRQGKLVEAASACRQAIGIKPDYVAAHLNLGGALEKLGKLDEAVSAYRRAISIRPDYPNAHFNLGVVLEKMGKLDAAVAAYRRATNIKPDHADAYCNLGVTLRKLCKFDEAVTACRQAVSIKPTHADAHCNLGVALQEQGKLDEAVAAFRQAISIKPGHADAHYNLGLTLQKQSKSDEAVAAYRQAISVNPDHADAHCNLGVALQELGKSEDAIAAYRRAFSIQPDHANAYSNLGVALQELGKIDDARNAFEKAIELMPRNARAYRLLGDVKRFRADDPHLAAMQELTREMPMHSPEESIELNFALSKAYADLGDHERSFRHLLEANALHRSRIVYDERATLTLFDRIRSVFTASLIREKGGFGHPSAVPVFIIGMPRSGTTLVEQILASHPQVCGAGELDDIFSAARKLRGAEDASLSFPEVVSSMAVDELGRFGAKYVGAVRARAPKAQRIVDKMPMNYLFAGLIHLALPNARIIHTRRDPVDTCVSCFSKLFTTSNTYSYDLAELGRYYRGYATLMQHWRTVLPPEVMLEVQYEDVTADLEGEARRIVAHCGLEWNDACLSFYETERPVRTASAAQVRQPIYQSSIGRWRSYEHLLGPLIEALGIDTAGGSGHAPSARVGEGEHAEGAKSSGVLPHPVPHDDTNSAAGTRRRFPAQQASPDAPTTQIFIDAVNTLAIHNGVLRIACVTEGPHSEERPSGTLLIPSRKVEQILGLILQAVRRLGKESARVGNDVVEKAAPAAATAPDDREEMAP
jgi:tetratricopeptide (TPR) repeat protein